MRKPLTRGLSASQAHATMDLWASAKNWEDLTLLYTFADGSQLEMVYPRATREASYKVDGEGVYTVNVPTNKFVCPVLGALCQTKMIQAARLAYEGTSVRVLRHENH